MSVLLMPGVISQQGYYTMFIEAQGSGTGVATLRFTVSSNITVTLRGGANFYTDAAGTLGESKTWAVASGDLRTIYVRCATGRSLIIFDANKVTQFGNSAKLGWVASTNAPKLTFDVQKLVNITQLYITGISLIIGAMPVNLTNLYLSGGNIAWTHSGALPDNLTYLYFSGGNIAWTHSGALPVNLARLYLSGGNIAWTHSGALPVNLAYLVLSGENIAWTYNTIGGSANYTSFMLYNYRITKSTSAQMVTLLDSLRTRTGNLPATITINDYADYANPPQSVLDAKAALIAAGKGVTTINLGA